MKSVGQLRHEQNLPVPQKQDSLYQVCAPDIKYDVMLLVTVDVCVYLCVLNSCFGGCY